MAEEGTSPLESVFEAFYIKSIIYTSGRALEAFRRYENGMKTSEDAEAIVGYLHEALIHSAALSRFFWPAWQKEMHLLRGEKLKKAFDLQENSPLNTKELRDALEHFDERLDIFLSKSRAGYFFPGSILGLDSLSDDPLSNIFRLVDPNTCTFVLLGNKYDFGLIYRVVKDIHDTATYMDENGGRLSND